MSSLQVLIVDDEKLSRHRLRRLLSGDVELAITGECASGYDCLRFLATHSPDLVFLDVQMPGMDGFGVIDAIGPERMPCTIFVTAYYQFALRAFEVHALDYLLKPFDEKRLAESVRRAKHQILNREAETDRERFRNMLQAMQASTRYRDRLAVKHGENLVILHADQVDWIQAADNYVNLHCGHETHTLRGTMNSLHQTLDPAKFIRIHRSAIVNLDRVKALQPWFRGDYRVVLTTGVQLTLSKSYRQSLRDRLMSS